MYYNHISDFFFKSKLSAARRVQIVNWVNSLTEEQQSMLDDIIRDAQQEERFNALDRITVE